jgi:hypothetical protein
MVTRVIEQWYSIIFVHIAPDVIYFQLSIPEVVGVQFELYTVYDLHPNKLNKLHPT